MDVVALPARAEPGGDFVGSGEAVDAAAAERDGVRSAHECAEGQGRYLACAGGAAADIHGAGVGGVENENSGAGAGGAALGTADAERGEREHGVWVMARGGMASERAVGGNAAEHSRNANVADEPLRRGRGGLRVSR